MIIRRAEQSDSAGICRVHVAAVRELCAGHYSAEQIDSWVGSKEPSSYVESIDHLEMFVAEDFQTVVGFGQLNPETGKVEAVYVHPSAKHRGFGHALLARLEEAARSRRVYELHLSASLNSIGFYESAGYRRLSESRHRLRNGVEIPCVMMTRTLEN